MKCLLSFYWLTVFYKLCGISTNYLANFARLDQKIYIDMKNRYDIDINPKKTNKQVFNKKTTK